jgi:hypothetical protein
MTLDVPLLRLDTPGVANVLHFNNAGAALPSRPVLDAMMGHLAREAAIGGMEAMVEAAGGEIPVHQVRRRARIAFPPRGDDGTAAADADNPRRAASPDTISAS